MATDLFDIHHGMLILRWANGVQNLALCQAHVILLNTVRFLQQHSDDFSYALWDGWQRRSSQFGSEIGLEDVFGLQASTKWTVSEASNRLGSAARVSD